LRSPNVGEKQPTSEPLLHGNKYSPSRSGPLLEPENYA
jgi:hypothetical protein